MLLIPLIFYAFAFITVLAAVAVISSRNPVHSVLFLILAFFSAAGLMVLIGAELLAMMLVIVYVGAVAVLFLFVVMMLNVNVTKMKEGFARHLPLGLLLVSALLAELVMILAAGVGGIALPDPARATQTSTNAEEIGRVLYTHYAYVFQLAGLILLVAMIGAIVLTHRQREGVRRQDILEQLARDPKKSVRLVKVQPGSGA